MLNAARLSQLNALSVCAGPPDWRPLFRFLGVGAGYLDGVIALLCKPPRPPWDRLCLMDAREWHGVQYNQGTQDRAGDDSEQQLLAAAILKDAVYWLRKEGGQERVYLDKLRRALAAISPEVDADFCARVEEALMDPSFFASFWRPEGRAPPSWMRGLGRLLVLASLWLAMELRARGSGPAIVMGVVRRADELHRRLVGSAARRGEVEPPELCGIIGFIEDEESQDFGALVELPALKEAIKVRAQEGPGRMSGRGRACQPC
jgi:hypothetical protein